jgi:uncharacterized protein (DUF2384 family)
LVLPTIRLKAGADFAPMAHDQLQRLVDTLGNNQAAGLLRVDKSQLSRCLAGKERISADLARRISDLAYILNRALQVMYADEVGPWLVEPEPLLGGSIPLNVLALSGPARLIAALDGIEAGAFA